MSRVQALPKELRDLLGRYASSGPYILSRLPKDIQEKLLWYLGPKDIIQINNNFPEVVRGHDVEFWTRKSNRDLGKQGLSAEDVRDYLLYVIADEEGLFDHEDARRWMGSQLFMYGWVMASIAAEEAIKTGNYNTIDKMMRISPGTVLWGAYDTLYDYIYTKYPKYRIPLAIIEDTYGRGERILPVVPKKDAEYWLGVIGQEPEPFVNAVDSL